MGTAGAHGAHEGDRQAQRRLQQGYVEFGVVGQDAQDRARVGLGALEVAVRPVDDDVVGFGEAGAGGEDGAGVADGDVVAEEFAGTYQCRGEVDRTEDDHAGRRHPRLDEQCQIGLAVGPARRDVDGAGAARVQHGAGLPQRRAVQPRIPAEAAFVRAVGTDEQRPAEEPGGALGHAGQGRRLSSGGGPQRRGEHGGIRGVRAYRRDQHLDDSAAGQAHREGVLGAVAEAFTHGDAVLERLGAQVVDGPFHTAAGDRADGRAAAVYGQGGAGAARGAATDGHDGGHGEVPALLQPAVQLIGDVQHPVLPRLLFPLPSG